MPRNKRPANKSERNGTWPPRPRSGRSKRQSLLPACSGAAGVKLQLPPGKADIETLRSATSEWLVPRLVEKFLRIHGFELRHSPKFANATNRLRSSLVGEGSLFAGRTADQESGSRVKKKNQYRELK